MKRFLLVALAACAHGQQVTNLAPDQAVKRAMQSHPTLAAGQARVEAAQGMQLQAGLRPNPRLFLQAENTRLGGTTAPFRFSQEADNFVYASQVLEAPGKRDSRVHVSAELIRRREAEADLLRTRIAQSVAIAYWQAVGAERTRDLLQETLRNFDQIVQYHRDRVREGALAESDLIRIELESGQIAVQFQNAEQDVRRLRLQLFREMGEQEQASVILTGDLSDTRPFVAPNPEEALESRRDLRLARQVVQHVSADVRVERINARPDTEVLFGYKRSMGYNTMIGGVQISLPFRNRNQGAIAATLAEGKAAELDLRAVEQAARIDIAAAQSEYNQKLVLVTDTLPRMRSRADDTVQIARAVYREGASDLLRLLDAERAGLQMQLLLVRSLTEYRLALVNLQAATGILP
ncbi:MAG TPA: TolC family protein [Bryobacteraceae bacterium]|nr:TolC family protein [Bryobacteraceae bacterium]